MAVEDAGRAALVFLYGTAAAGKYTVGEALCRQTGFAFFHNHLVVDALLAVFPFGSPAFVNLRERMWLDVLAAAAAENRSVVFTFQPEPSVEEGFALRAADAFRARGGEAVFVRLTVSQDAQEQRIGDPARAAFRKLRDPELMRRLRNDWAEAEAKMPEPDIVIDTSLTPPEDAARRIAGLLA